MTTTIICEWCKQIVRHEPRRITGCNCDPDAPQWCYINPEGKPQGLSAARYTIITEGTKHEKETPHR